MHNWRTVSVVTIQKQECFWSIQDYHVARTGMLDWSLIMIPCLLVTSTAINVL